MFYPGFETRARKLESGHPADFAPSWLTGSGAYSGVTVSPYTALQNTAFYCGVQIRANLVSQVPLKLFRRRDDGGREEVREHDAYWLMHEEPNEETTSVIFRETLEGHRWAWGNGYAEIQRGGNGRLEAVYQLRPDRMDLRRQKGRLWYIYDTTALAPAEILHVPGLSFNGLKAFSPVEMQREALGAGIAAQQFGATFFGNGATFGGVLQRPLEAPPLDAESEERVLDAIEARHKGVQRAHRLFMLQEGTTFKEIGIEPERAQFLETRQFNTVEMAQILNLPPHVLKDLSRATFSNIEHQYLELLILSALPEYVTWEQELNRKLLTRRERRDEGLYFEFVVDGLLRGDTKSRWEAYRTQWMMGVPLNRILKLENMDPVEGGEKSYVPANFIESGTADQVPAGLSPLRSLPEARSARAQRSVASRLRLREAFLGLLRQAAARLVTAEVRAIRKELQRLPTLGDAAFRAWVRQFFERHEQFAREILGPVLIAYLEAAAGDVAEEMGQDAADFRADVEVFAGQYRDVAAYRHAESGRNQLFALLDAADTLEAAESSLLERLAEWEEKSPDKIASREASQGVNAVSALIYGLAGVTVLRWHWPGGSECPLCPRMHGRTVEVQGAFLKPGDVVTTEEEGTADLQVKQLMRHPPLHRGCNCLVVPGG